MDVRTELREMFWRIEFPLSGDKIKEDTVTKEDVIEAVQSFTSNDMQHVISKVNDYVDKVEAERDHYKAESEKFRKALEKIAKYLVYDSEDELFEFIQNNLDDTMADYMDAYRAAKQALQGDDV